MMTSLSKSLTCSPSLPVQEGSTALYRACFSGDSEAVQALLEGGANVNQQNDVSILDLCPSIGSLLVSCLPHRMKKVRLLSLEQVVMDTPTSSPHYLAVVQLWTL